MVQIGCKFYSDGVRKISIESSDPFELCPYCAQNKFRISKYIENLTS